jgi:hypothetical protein
MVVYSSHCSQRIMACFDPQRPILIFAVGLILKITAFVRNPTDSCLLALHHRPPKAVIGDREFGNAPAQCREALCPNRLHVC